MEVPDTLKSLSFIEKDSTRFPNTHGWAYAQFTYDTQSKTFKPSMTGSECGYACHTKVASRDYIFRIPASVSRDLTDANEFSRALPHVLGTVQLKTKLRALQLQFGKCIPVSCSLRVHNSLASSRLIAQGLTPRSSVESPGTGTAMSQFSQ